MIQSIYWMLQGTFLKNVGTVLIITIPIFIIILLLKFFIKGKSCLSITKCTGEFIFLGYIVTVLLLTDTLSINLNDFSSFHMTPNLIPLITTLKDFSNYPSIVLEQVLLNIVFSIPFGVLFTTLYTKGKKRFFKTLLVALLFAAGIEILEYFTGRYMDIDDILWNTTGAIIGSSLYCLIFNILNKSKNKVTNT
ncbi:MAG: VanZ family protein [Sarcina sp.]